MVKLGTICSDICYNADELQTYYAKSNEPDAKDAKYCYNSIYMECPEKENL